MTAGLSAELTTYQVGRRLPCAVAFRIAQASGVTPHAVREAADQEGIRISECQLGLFGYEPYGEKRWTRRLAALPPELEASVRAACVEGRLPCAAAWKVADDRGIPRLLIGSIAETLDLRISLCQLGCFE